MPRRLHLSRGPKFGGRVRPKQNFLSRFFIDIFSGIVFARFFANCRKYWIIFWQFLIFVPFLQKYYVYLHTSSFSRRQIPACRQVVPALVGALLIYPVRNNTPLLLAPLETKFLTGREFLTGFISLKHLLIVLL